MRVLFVGEDLHVAMPVGRFIVRRSGEIEWLTDYAPLKTHADPLDGDIVAPGREVPEGAHDALLLEGGRMAVLLDDRVEVLDRDDEVEMSASLEGDGERLPGVDPAREHWEKRTQFAGYRRGMRLFPANGGFLVAANESGHVARFSLEGRRFERIVRVPAAPENTVYAADGPGGLVIGMKWNGRHSDIFILDENDELAARWLDEDTDEVRWGMPGMAPIGGKIVTYSDEGPHRSQLALLDARDLRELHHAPIAAWPQDIATDGERFAAVGSDLLVIGHVEGDRILLDSQWTVRDLLERANVKAPERTMAATDDGAGTRRWLEERITALQHDGKRLLLVAKDGIVTLEGDERKVLLSSAIERTLLDAQGDRLLVREGGRYRVLEGPKLTERMVAQPDGERRFGQCAWLFEGGLLHVDRMGERFEETFELVWCPPAGAPKGLASSTRDGAGDAFVLARREGEAAWYELQTEGNTKEHWIVRWGPNTKRGQSVQVEDPVRALAFDGATLYATAGRYSSETGLYRVTPEGAVEQVTEDTLPFASHGLVIGGGRAFFATGTSSGPGAQIQPSRLFAVDLATGHQSLLATATTGEFTSLTVAADRLWWLEAVTSGMSFLKQGQDEGLSAVCSLPL